MDPLEFGRGKDTRGFCARHGRMRAKLLRRPRAGRAPFSRSAGHRQGKCVTRYLLHRILNCKSSQGHRALQLRANLLYTCRQALQDPRAEIACRYPEFETELSHVELDRKVKVVESESVSEPDRPEVERQSCEEECCDDMDPLEIGWGKDTRRFCARRGRMRAELLRKVAGRASYSRSAGRGQGRRAPRRTEARLHTGLECRHTCADLLYTCRRALKDPHAEMACRYPEGLSMERILQLFEAVEMDRKLGQGSFGKVFFGWWRGSPVAVKVVVSKSVSKPKFEAELSCTLSHSNLVQTFAYSTREKSRGTSDIDKVCYETWIVQEWCDMGTLGMLCSHPRNSTKGYIEALWILGDIASGGSYLHSRRIIHGDLSANNVLCKKQVSVKGYVCKICDFGLARVLERESTGILNPQLGTRVYMPPELFLKDTPRVLTTKADVYAAGILLWQTVHGRFPRKINAIVEPRGARLRMPLGAPECIKRIFSGCTADQPSARPSMCQLVAFESYTRQVWQYMDPRA